MQAFYFVKRFPRRFKTANEQKIFSLAQSLLNNGYQVSFVSADLSQPSSYKQLQDYPINLVHVNQKKISASLSAAQLKPDLSIFNNYQMENMYSAYVYNKWHKCPRILQINHLPTVQKWRKKNYISGIGSPIAQLNCSLYDRNQLFSSLHQKSILRSDFIFCPNDFIYFLTKLYTNQANNISILSFGYRMQDYLVQIKQRDYRPFQSRKHFCMMMDLRKPDNIMLIKIIAKSLWLDIKKRLKDAQLHIYSSNNNIKANNMKKQLQSVGIYLKGHMEDTKQIQKYKLTLYPAKYSVGLKGTIIQSWLNHTPVVTTPVGAQGMFFQSFQAKFSSPQNPTQDGFLSQRQYTEAQIKSQKLVKSYYLLNRMGKDLTKFTFGGSFLNWTVDQFVNSSVQLYTNKQKWEKCLQMGHKTMLKNQSQTQMEKNLKFSLSRLQLAMYQCRGSKQYQQEWKRFNRTKQYINHVYSWNSQKDSQISAEAQKQTLH